MLYRFFYDALCAQVPGFYKVSEDVWKLETEDVTYDIRKEGRFFTLSNPHVDEKIFYDSMYFFDPVIYALKKCETILNDRRLASDFRRARLNLEYITKPIDEGLQTLLDPLFDVYCYEETEREV